MEQRQLRELLERVAAGEVAVGEAEQALRIAPFTELGYATVDNHRGVRRCWRPPKRPACPTGIITTCAR